MPNNNGLIQAIDDAGIVNADVVGEVVKTIDLGEMADVLKGQTLHVCVNPAAFIAPLLWKAYENVTRDQMLFALGVMTGIPASAWARWSDQFVSDIFYRVRALFFEHDEQLRKNSKAQPTPTLIP